MKQQEYEYRHIGPYPWVNGLSEFLEAARSVEREGYKLVGVQHMGRLMYALYRRPVVFVQCSFFAEVDTE